MSLYAVLADGFCVSKFTVGESVRTWGIAMRCRTSGEGAWGRQRPTLAVSPMFVAAVRDATDDSQK